MWSQSPIHFFQDYRLQALQHNRKTDMHRLATNQIGKYTQNTEAGICECICLILLHFLKSWIVLLWK